MGALEPGTILLGAGVLGAIFVVFGVALVRRGRGGRVGPDSAFAGAIRITPHARERMSERGVTEDDLRRVLARPEREVPTTYLDSGGRAAISDVAERDSMRLERTFSGRAWKVWVPPDWRASDPVVIKSVAWQHVAVVPVPRNRLGAVIGSGGRMVRTIEAGYGVRLHIDARSALVRVVGDEGPAVAAAEAAVRRLSR